KGNIVGVARIDDEWIDAIFEGGFLGRVENAINRGDRFARIIQIAVFHDRSLSGPWAWIEQILFLRIFRGIALRHRRRYARRSVAVIKALKIGTRAARLCWT